MSRKLVLVLIGAFLILGLVGFLFAQEGQAEVEKVRGWAIYIGAALAVGLPAIATGYAQARIGAAGAGALAERPDILGPIIIMIAIPETAVILGFVVSVLLLIM